MLRIRVFDSVSEIAAHLGFSRAGRIVEEDVDVVETDCDWFERKRRDAEVLTTIAANIEGDILELGTSHGRGTSELAANLAGRGNVHTVNILPEQADTGSGKLVTHFLSRVEIGSYYRARGLSNVVQIYADTTRWQPSSELGGHFAAAFVDAAHDEENVYRDSLKVAGLLRDGGFLLWHDFTPFRRREYDWIDASMRGAERFAAGLAGDIEVLHLRNSWIGIARLSATRPPVATPPASAGQASGGSLPRPAAAGAPAFAASVASAAMPPEGAVRLRPGQDRFLIGYSHYPYPSDVGAANEAWLARLREQGCAVDGICLTIDPPAGCLSWTELESAWTRRDPALMALYDRIRRRIRETGATVFVNYNGINLHPEFVLELRRQCTTVYCCFDDPESTAWLSRPVAAWYDVAMVGNIAELDMYRSWGCPHVEWLPIGFRADEVDPSVTERSILEGPRGTDLSIVCERTSPWRRERLDQIARAFPQGRYHGAGWPAGFISEAEKIRLLADTRIGFNLHNSTGPINYRTFTVPASGAMLLCDNSTQLGKIFDLGVEAVGYDYIDEAVFDARFYLGRETRRREIAAAGWLRVMRDYTEIACFRRLASAVDEARGRKQRLALGRAGGHSAHQAVRVQHLDWELDRRRYIDRQILEQGIFEESTTVGLQELVRPGMRWLDVGANIGYYTMLLSKWATEKGKGWAYEPTPHLAAHLRRHAQINGVGGRFELRERGLGDAVAEAEIGFDDVSATMHWPHAQAPAQTAPIRIVPLDGESDLMAEAGIDVVKIDIDGHEPFFFRGAREFFARHRPILAMEFANLNLRIAGESVESLVEELGSIGYVPVSEKTLAPYPDAIAFLVECGNYAFSANAWAVPSELLEAYGDLGRIRDELPRSMVDELEVFASARDYLLWKNIPAGARRRVRIRPLGGAEIELRGGTSDATVVWDAFHFRYHVPPRPLPDQAVILDLGANIGLTAAEMGAAHPGARIVAVELDAENAEVAEANTAFLGARCKVLNAGIWTEDGTIEYSGISQQGFAIGSARGDTRSAPGLRIATLLANEGIDRVDYLKMDIEGAELAVLRDGADWLGRVASIKVELHEMDEFEEVWRLLEEHGFRCSKERKHYCCIEGVRN